MPFKVINFLTLNLLVLLAGACFASDKTFQEELSDPGFRINRATYTSTLVKCRADKDEKYIAKRFEEEANQYLLKYNNCSDEIFTKDQRKSVVALMRAKETSKQFQDIQALKILYPSKSAGSGPPPDKFPFLSVGLGPPPDKLPFFDQLKSQVDIPIQDNALIKSGIFPPPDERLSYPFHLIKYPLTCELTKRSQKGIKVDDYSYCLPNVPDEILAQFLIFLPTDDYVQAHLISKRFYRIAHNAQLVIAHFEEVSQNPHLFGIAVPTEELKQQFDSLWPVMSSLEQREAETLAFENKFKKDIHTLWKEARFHSQALQNSPLNFDNDMFYKSTIYLNKILFDTVYSETSKYRTLNQLLEIFHIVTVHESKKTVISDKFVAYARAFIPQLSQTKLDKCKFDSWTTVSYLAHLNHNLPQLQFNLLPQLQEFLVPLNIDDQPQLQEFLVPQNTDEELNPEEHT